MEGIEQLKEYKELFSTWLDLIQLTGEPTEQNYDNSIAVTYCHVNPMMIGSRVILRSCLMGLIWCQDRKYDPPSGDN